MKLIKQTRQGWHFGVACRKEMYKLVKELVGSYEIPKPCDNIYYYYEKADRRSAVVVMQYTGEFDENVIIRVWVAAIDSQDVMIMKHVHN